MWKWLKSHIFKPIANFFRRIGASIARFNSRKLKKKQEDRNSNALVISHPTIQQSTNPSREQSPFNIPNMFSLLTNNGKITASQFFTRDMPQVMPDRQFTQMMANLAKTNRFYRDMFKDELTKRAYIAFSQAVVDEDYPMLEKILKARPYLLTMAPPKGLEIESKLTWQRFIAEKPAVMAAKRKQAEMLEFLIPYYDKINDKVAANAAKQEALDAWVPYELQKILGRDEIVIPQEYTDYANSLIDVFAQETFPNGTGNFGYGQLSETTEAALSALFDRLLPKIAVKADYLDIDLFLLAFYKAYLNNYQKFNNNWDQQDAFCVRGIGLIQGALAPEPAKKFCDGLNDIVNALMNNKKIKISDLAANFKLKWGESFYRASLDSKSGVGFNFLVGIFGVGWADVARGGTDGRPSSDWNTYVKQKQRYWQSYAADKQKDRLAFNRSK